MQLGGAHLSLEERRRRQQEGRRFYCGKPDHLVPNCQAIRATAVSQFTAPQSAPRKLTR